MSLRITNEMVISFLLESKIQIKQESETIKILKEKYLSKINGINLKKFIFEIVHLR